VTDSELLERTRQGDGQAFTALFRSHQAAVYPYAAYMCGRDVADDVVQETLLTMTSWGSRFTQPDAD
jgi:DNA-directed RNA polymerase specialized sigma24 family protein